MKPPKEYAKELVQTYRLVSLKMSMKDAKTINYETAITNNLRRFN